MLLERYSISAITPVVRVRVTVSIGVENRVRVRVRVRVGVRVTQTHLGSTLAMRQELVAFIQRKSPEVCTHCHTSLIQYTRFGIHTIGNFE